MKTRPVFPGVSAFLAIAYRLQANFFGGNVGILPGMVQANQSTAMPRDLRSLSAVARSIPGGKVNPSTPWRWARVGIRRGDRHIKLPYFRVGNRIMVSEADLTGFFRALAEADEQPACAASTSRTATPPRGRTDIQRQRDIAAAEATCAAMGV